MDSKRCLPRCDEKGMKGRQVFRPHAEWERTLFDRHQHRIRTEHNRDGGLAGETEAATDGKRKKENVKQNTKYNANDKYTVVS